MGSLTYFQAVPGFGLECNVGNINALVSGKPDILDIDSVNNFIEGTFSIY